MLLEIRHVTEFRYDAPIRESVMELWMQPQKSGRQRLVSFELDLDPPARLFSYADTFGNAVYHFDVPQPHDGLTIVARSAVDSQPPPPLPEALDYGEWDRLRSGFVQRDAFEFLQPHGFAVETPALRAFMEDKGLDRLRAMDPLSAVRALSQVIYEAFDFQTGVTTAESPIDHALAEGRGVCQDFTHIMIAVCRAWGVPARYVSGYLFNDQQHGERSDPDASHAWVEVLLPSLRWVGIDPTNNVEAGERHVAVALGRDYSDVSPTRGVFKGGAESRLAVGVSVRPARSAIAEPEFLRTRRAFVNATGRGPRPAGGFDYEQQQQQQ